MDMKSVLRILAGAAIFVSAGAIAADNVSITGTVSYQGKPVEGASVSASGGVAKTGADGRFRIGGIPALHPVGFRHFRKAKDGAFEYQDVTANVPYIVVAAYAEREEKALLGFSARKVELGTVTVVASGDAGKPLTLVLEPVGDWEALCRKCHPTSPVMEPGIILRPAKKDAPKPKVTKELFTRYRFRDTHPSGFEYGKAVEKRSRKTAFAEKVEELPLAAGERVDCRTCHSFHQAGKLPSFAREEFRGKNDLCQRCHR